MSQHLKGGAGGRTLQAKAVPEGGHSRPGDCMSDTQGSPRHGDPRVRKEGGARGVGRKGGGGPLMEKEK